MPIDDFSSDLSTDGTVDVGGFVTGVIEEGGDQDWFRVYLEAGRLYQIDLEGSSTEQGTLSDAYLKGIYDSSGAQLSGSTDDDSGNGLNARLAYEPDITGYYYLSSGGYGSATGSYKLSVSDITPRPVNVITFSEVGYEVGDINPVYIFDDNQVQVIGKIINDGSQPYTPAVAANSDYIGPVYITFLNPVDYVSFDAGYFDDLGSTTIQYIGPGGAVLHTETNSDTGILSYEYENPAGIAAIHVVNTGTDGNGFSVDTVVFGLALSETSVVASFSLESAGVTQLEGDTGSTLFRFAVVRTGDLSAAATLGWAVTSHGDNSADAADFIGGEYPTGTLTFTVGESLRYIEVEVAGETEIEDDEWFAVNLIAPSAGNGLGTSSVLAGIENDDGLDDYPSDLSTHGTVAVGGTVIGRIEEGGDQDWFAVYLEAGRSYRIDLEGEDTGQGTLSDTYFRGIYDTAGTLITGSTNDDGGYGTNSQVIFEPEVGGYYYLSAGGYSSATGTYKLSVTDITPRELNTIIFSEPGYYVGDINPVYTFDDNQVHVIGQIINDGSQPYTPAVAAKSDYIGPVYITFLNPVDYVSFDAGYFDDLGSTTIQYIGPGGAVLHTETNSDTGILSYEYENPAGIAAIHVVNTGTDGNGFSVDTVAFGLALSETSVVASFSLESADVTQWEGDNGGTLFRFAVVRTGDLSAAATLGWAVTNLGEMTANAEDFVDGQYPNGTLSFAAGVSVQYIDVLVAGDIEIEDDEWFAVNLIAPSAGNAIGTASVVATIQNDDGIDDYLSTVETTGAVSMNGTSTGHIETSGDLDWFAVELLAGHEYVIDLEGASTGEGTLVDPRLHGVYDSLGVLISGTSDDGSGEGGNSQLTFIPDESGSYFLSAGAHSTGTGTYRISVSETTSAGFGGGSFTAPLDLMFLHDLSGSFLDDVETVRTLVPDLVATIRSYQPDSLFGVASFVDKATGTFGDAGDYVYQTDLSLTADESALQSVVDNLEVLGGYDYAESQIEALMQLALRASEVGYREGSTRVAVLMTDAAYHVAGDFADAPVNNGDTVLDGSPEGTGEDYPSLSQLKAALEASDIVPIFAVTSDVVSLYEDLVEYLGIGTVVTLSSDSRDLVDALEQGLAWVASNIEQAEGDSGATAYTFTVVREGDLSDTASADWSVAGIGDATADSSDFVGGVIPSGRVEFGVGESTATITIYVSGDTDYESDESFRVTLSNAEGMELSSIAYYADGTILNDDSEDDYLSTVETAGVVSVNGSSTGYIETSGDRDWFAVELLAGHEYVIDLEGASTGEGTLSDPYLYGLYNVSGIQVGSYKDDDGGIGLNSSITYIASNSGTLFISAGAFYENTGTYSLSVTDVTVDDDYGESVGAVSPTVGLIDVNGTVTGEIEAPYDHDWFSVYLEAGGTYRVDLEGVITGAGSISDTVFRGVYDEAGAYIYGTYNDDGGIGYNSRQLFTVANAGIYYLSTSGYGYSTGTYSLSLELLSLDDFADNISTKGVVAEDGTTLGEIETVGDHDWFSVSLDAGTTYEISLRGAPTDEGSLSDPLLEGVYTSNGTWVAGTFDDDGGVATNSFTLFSPGTSGTYFISASAYGDEIGTYTVEVRALGEIVDDYLEDAATTGVVVVDGSAEGEIESAGDIDWFRVELTAGQVVQIDLSGEDSSQGTLVDPYLSGLYDSSGALIIGTADDDSGVGLDSRTTFTVTESGSYFIGASSVGAGTGNYTVSVIDVTPEPSAGEFDIVVDFSGDTRYLAIFEAAAARWEEIIVGDLPDIYSSSFGFIDDLLINASVVPIDGESGILGQAGADYVRNDGSLLPIHGIMQFDSADMAYMQSQGILEEVILHEMGHVLGFSDYFFSNLGLSNGTQYTGENALRYYEALTGHVQAYIPLEDGGGTGTAYSHWEEDIFDEELMTGYAENYPAMPISVLTVGALEDLGYTVDVTQADDYAIASFGLTSVSVELGTVPNSELGVQSISVEEASGFNGSSYTYAGDKSVTITTDFSVDKLEGVLTQFTEGAVYFVETTSGRNATVRLDGVFDKNNPGTLADLKGTVDQITFYTGILELEQSLIYSEPLDVEAVLNDWFRADSIDNNWISLEGDFSDSIAAGSGDDLIDAGGGDDTVIFEEAISNYFIFLSPENSEKYITIDLDRVGFDEGRDVLENVEFLSFGGEVLSADTAISTLQIIDDDEYFWNSEIGLPNEDRVSTSEAQLYRTYFGALQRTPDDGGYSWWLSEIEAGRQDLRSMAAGFLWSEEFLGYVDAPDGGSIDNEVFLTHMYRGVFGRDPDGEGYYWWLSELESGNRSQVDVLVDMTQSNEYVELTMVGAVDYLFGSYEPV